MTSQDQILKERLSLVKRFLSWYRRDLRRAGKLAELGAPESTLSALQQSANNWKSQAHYWAARVLSFCAKYNVDVPTGKSATLKLIQEVSTQEV